MKKNLSIAFAILAVVALSAFTMNKPFAGHGSQKKTVDYIQFHFQPANGSETAFEDPESWEVVSSNPGCGASGSDPCVITVDVSLLADISDDEAAIASLVSYLYAQDGTGQYADASEAVADMTTISKL